MIQMSVYEMCMLTTQNVYFSPPLDSTIPPFSTVADQQNTNARLPALLMQLIWLKSLQKDAELNAAVAKKLRTYVVDDSDSGDEPPCKYIKKR